MPGTTISQRKQILNTDRPMIPLPWAKLPQPEMAAKVV